MKTLLHLRKVQPLTVASKLSVSGIFLLLLFLLNACQKADFSPAVKAERLDVAAAKEWWYGSFRKSAAYTQRNTAADIYQLQWAEQPASASTNAAYNKEQAFYPSWKNAKQYHGKAFDYVDVPLVSKYIVLPLPLVPGETHQDRLKIAAASMQRLMIVKQKSGATLVRVVTVIPSFSYLKAHHYLLPFSSIKDLPGDFDGIVTVRKWDATEVASWWIKDGHKRKIMMKAKAKKTFAATNASEPVPCPPVWDVVDYHYTCIDVHEGDADEPSGYCDDPNNWQQGEPIWDWVYPPGDCYEGGEDDYCEGMTNETCMCETYGLGCEGGGGEEYDYDEITIDINDPCIRDSYDKLDLATSGVKYSLLSWANSLFGSTYDFNLTYSDGHNLKLNVFAEWKFTISGSGSYNGFINIDDSKLKNTAKEWQVYAILHELYHGYLATKGFDVLSTNDHNLFSQYRSRMMNQLMLVFPLLSSDDAYCLSWGGLQSTIQWGNLSAAEKGRIQKIINSYINKTTGTPC